MQSFLSGRPVVRGTPPPAEPQQGESVFKPYLAAAAAPQEAQQSAVVAKEDLLNQLAPPPPAVEVQEVDGVVRRIIVKCSCCRTIELDCIY